MAKEELTQLNIRELHPKTKRKFDLHKIYKNMTSSEMLYFLINFYEKNKNRKKNEKI